MYEKKILLTKNTNYTIIFFSYYDKKMLNGLVLLPGLISHDYLTNNTLDAALEDQIKDLCKVVSKNHEA